MSRLPFEYNDEIFNGDLRTRDGVIEHEADCWVIFPVFDLMDDELSTEGELLGWEIRPLTDEEYDRRERDREIFALHHELYESDRGQALVALYAVLFVILVGLAGWGYLELVWWLETRKP